MSELRAQDRLRDRTIADFGAQWTRYPTNDGYYASDAFFADQVAPLLSPDDFRGALCAEIGAGSGNISAMMLRAGARALVAVEPSVAVGPLRENLAPFGDRVEIVAARGEALPARDFDLVLSIGVLHHIPDPLPVVEAAYRALRPGGRLFVWLYGREGNGAYLTFALPMRALTKRLPVGALGAVAYGLDACLMPVGQLAKRGVPVPLGDYFRDIYMRLDGPKRRLVIVDQLKPAYAKYYTRAEAEQLLSAAGFADVRLHHRHGYSWSVIGTRPA